jgi:hypothetical protein
MDIDTDIGLPSQTARDAVFYIGMQRLFLREGPVPDPLPKQRMIFGNLLYDPIPDHIGPAVPHIGHSKFVIFDNRSDHGRCHPTMRDSPFCIMINLIPYLSDELVQALTYLHLWLAEIFIEHLLSCITAGYFALRFSAHAVSDDIQTTAGLEVSEIVRLKVSHKILVMGPFLAGMCDG